MVGSRMIQAVIQPSAIDWRPFLQAVDFSWDVHHHHHQHSGTWHWLHIGFATPPPFNSHDGFIHLNSSCPTDRDLYLTKNAFLILSYGKGHFVSLTSWPSMHHKWVWFETSFSSNKSHKFWDTRDLSWMNERDICFLTEFQTARGSYHLIFMFSLHCLVQTGM